MASSKSDICNLSQIFLGEKPNINSLETPETDRESIYKIRYDVTRRLLIRELKPSFAIHRRQIAQIDEDILFGFNKVYEYPADCLKLLGIGTIDNNDKNYSLENNRIYTDEGLQIEGSDNYYLNIRFLLDEECVNCFDDSFVNVFALQLAVDVATSIRGSLELTNFLKSQIALEKAKLKAIDSQENKPLRVSNSKFLASKFIDQPTWNYKK